MRPPAQADNPQYCQGDDCKQLVRENRLALPNLSVRNVIFTSHSALLIEGSVSALSLRYLEGCALIRSSDTLSCQA